MFWFFLCYILIGAIAGFAAGLFGIGGGAILVPAFYYTLGWVYPEADHLMQISLGTALATIVVTGLSSVRAHAVRGNVRKDILYKLAPGIALGAGLSALIADMVDSASLKTFFAGMMLILAVLMASDPSKFKAHAVFPNTVLSNLAGVISGLLSGLLGIGGAILNVPYMSFFQTPMREAVGTASALGLFIAVPSALGYILAGWNDVSGVPYTLGYIFLPGWLAVISMTSFTAVYGARMAHGLDPLRLKRIFALFVLAVAVMMLGDELF